MKVVNVEERTQINGTIIGYVRQTSGAFNPYKVELEIFIKIISQVKVRVLL